jgi:hypothetical protein
MVIRYISVIVLSAVLLVACGGTPAPTGGSAPTSAPAAPTQPPEATAAPATAVATQPPEATAAPAQSPEATAAPATAAPTQPPEATAVVKPSGGDAGTPTGDLQGIIVIFKRSGGIAGIDETLTIYEDGRLTLVGRDRKSTTQVAPDMLSELRRLLATPEFAALSARYSALGADLFTYSITTSIGGKSQTIVTMDGAENPPILDQVLIEMGKLLKAQTK